MTEEVLHINIPFFLSSVESLYDPSLREKVFILASSGSPFSPVLDVSEVAYKCGIRRGMTIGEARSIEKNLTLIRPDSRRYRSILERIESIISRFTPIYELLPSAEAYLDVKGLKLIFKNTEDLAIRVAREIYSGTGLKSHLGIGSNKLISRAAASMFSGEALTKVMQGSERAFISPMSVRILPGIDNETLKRLFDYSIFTVGDIRNIGSEYLYTIFGRLGERLRLWSEGLDPRPIITKNAPFIRVETDLSCEENAEGPLKKRIFALASEAGFGLRERRVIAIRFRLIITYTDNLISEGFTGVRGGTSSSLTIYRVIMRLFQRIRKRRVNIKHILLEASLLSPLFVQEELIPLPQSKERRLFSAIDSIRSRFGEDSIRFGIEYEI